MIESGLKKIEGKIMRERDAEEDEKERLKALAQRQIEQCGVNECEYEKVISSKDTEIKEKESQAELLKMELMKYQEELRNEVLKYKTKLMEEEKGVGVIKEELREASIQVISRAIEAITYKYSQVEAKLARLIAKYEALHKQKLQAKSIKQNEAFHQEQALNEQNAKLKAEIDLLQKQHSDRAARRDFWKFAAYYIPITIVLLSVFLSAFL